MSSWPVFAMVVSWFTLRRASPTSVWFWGHFRSRGYGLARPHGRARPKGTDGFTHGRGSNCSVKSSFIILL